MKDVRLNSSKNSRNGMSMLGKARRLTNWLREKKIDEKKYKADVAEYIRLSTESDVFHYHKDDEIPMLTEYREPAANLDAHYFLQDIWFAKRIISSSPIVHYDIGSRVDGFLAHLLSAGVRVNMIDIRPLKMELEGLSFIKGDATDLTNIDENSIDSLSSLHVIEHFGLGRYGDSIDPNGWIKGLKAMQRIVAKGGVFYLSVPVASKNKLCFNAHRLFEYHEVVKALDQMELIETAYICKYKTMDVPIDRFQQTNVVDEYACGLYVFRKTV